MHGPRWWGTPPDLRVPRQNQRPSAPALLGSTSAVTLIVPPGKPPFTANETCSRCASLPADHEIRFTSCCYASRMLATVRADRPPGMSVAFSRLRWEAEASDEFDAMCC